MIKSALRVSGLTRACFLAFPLLPLQASPGPTDRPDGNAVSHNREMHSLVDRRAVIVTCDAASEAVTLEELRRFDANGLPGTWLDTGDAVQGSLLLLDLEDTFEVFSSGVSDSIFVRHLAPVEWQMELQGDESDLAALTGLASILAPRLDPQDPFSVQTRILGTGKLPYRKVVLNETLSQELEKLSGAQMDCRHPEQVVSILCTPQHAYVGVSCAGENRSEWPGGKHRFKKEDDQISRAEFKLLEAMSVFGFEFPTQGLALDIGASPGGWSRVLASRGLKVDAVDPGDLDQRLRAYKGVTHYRRRIQEYRPGSKRFAVIVNDMKMDAQDSIQIMSDYAELLSEDGIGVMTLKMPILENSLQAAKRVLNMLQVDLERLAARYDVVGARQLYHNRSEVTVVLRSKRVM